MQRTGNKWVKKLLELQTTGDSDYQAAHSPGHLVDFRVGILYYQLKATFPLGNLQAKLIANGSYRVSKDSPSFVDLVSQW